MQIGIQNLWLNHDTHAQAQMSLSYPIPSYGYKVSSRSMVSYLQPIKGMGNISIAFSKLQNRFSGLTRGIIGIKCRAVQD